MKLTSPASRLFFFWIVTAPFYQLHAQTDWLAKAKTSWSAAEIEQASTAKSAKDLCDQEKELYLLTNLARLDGAKFYRELAEPYIKEKNKEASSYTKTLKTDLEKIKDLPLLKVNENLCKAAAFHAEEMGKNGGIGHDSSDGTDCFQRIRKYYSGGSMAENCSYGYSSAMDILMQLLIDDGVESLGHRKNMLNKVYLQMGVSIRPHKGYRYNCVTDFSD